MARSAKEYPTVESLDKLVKAKNVDFTAEDAKHITTVYFETTDDGEKIICASLAPERSTEGLVAWQKLVNAAGEQVTDDKGNRTFPDGNLYAVDCIINGQVSGVRSRVSKDNRDESGTWLVPPPSTRLKDRDEMVGAWALEYFKENHSFPTDEQIEERFGKVSK